MSVLTNPIDRSLKALARNYPATFIRLAMGTSENRFFYTIENPEINIPEKRADLVYQIEQEDAKYLLHLEFQLHHEKDVPERMFKYSAFLTESYRLPVIPAVIYLERRNYRQLPSEYSVELDGKIMSRFTYQAIKLWDYSEAIAGGELKELAPLLIMLAEEKSADVLAKTRQLILTAENKKWQADALSVAVTVAERYLDREFLLQFFNEEVAILKESSIVQDWINEGIQKGMEKGMEKGMQKGKIEALREDILEILEERFDLVTRGIDKKLRETDSPAVLRFLLKKSARVNSIEEFQEILKTV